MKFMVSMITDETSTEAPEPGEAEEMAGKMMELMGELSDSGALLHTDKLGPSANARTLRHGANGEVVVTDGPFAESKEQIAGYMVLECEDLEEAVGWAERLPVRGGTIEVRPIAESAPENFEGYKDAA